MVTVFTMIYAHSVPVRILGSPWMRPPHPNTYHGCAIVHVARSHCPNYYTMQEAIQLIG